MITGERFSKMDITTKARFIEDFVGDYGKDEQYLDFFIYNDLGSRQ